VSISEPHHWTSFVEHFFSYVFAEISHSTFPFFADYLKINKCIKSAEDMEALHVDNCAAQQLCGENNMKIKNQKIKLYLSDV
jgi:hypothetical protein